VQDDYERRALIAALAVAQDKVLAEPEAAAAELVTTVNQILSRSEEKTVFDGIEATRLTLDMIIAAEKRVKAGKLVRWSMSTDKLANLIPLMPGKMHVLAMRSGGGKTSVACDGAQFTAGANEPFGFHSVEMPVPELNLRMMSQVVDIDELSCLQGRPTPRCLPNAELYANQTGPARNPLFITRPGPTIEDVERRVRHLYAVHGVRYHAVDYFQLLRSSQRFDSRMGELNYIGQRLKQLTVELPGCAVLVLAQLNKHWAKETPSKEDIRFGSGLTDSADGVTLGWRPNKGTDEDREVVFRLDKGRFGGEGTQRFTWNEGRVIDGFAPLRKELNRRYELVRRQKEYSSE
jgi:replicative DNA helicase